MRRALFVGGSYLLALGAGAIISPALAVVFVIVGTVAMLSAWDPAGQRLPSVAVVPGTGPQVATLRIDKPAGGRKKRLQRETARVVNELHAYDSSAQPSRDLEHRERASYGIQMSAAKTEEEKNEIWHKQTAELSMRHDQQRSDFQRRFYGDLLYLFEEYERLGLYTVSRESNRPTPGFRARTAGSSDALALAAELHALAKRL